MLRRPVEAELAAAVAAAAKAGLGQVTPVVLHLGNHTTAKLEPWPLVARIASGSSFDFSGAGIERELRVAAYLSSRDAPAVRLARDVEPGPHRDNDCIITFWEFVEGRALSGEKDAFSAATSLHLIHDALAGLEADLPSFITKVESCESILEDTAEAPKLQGNDRLFLEKIYADLRKQLGSVGGEWRPLHGDTHVGNVLMTGSGAVWMDLEATCLGPLEWDIVNLPRATWRLFSEPDDALLRLFSDVRSLCVAVWCWAEFDRSAAAAEAANHHLLQLKSRFG